MRGEHTVLSVAIGKKIEQPLSETYRIEFTYEVDHDDYLTMKRREYLSQQTLP